MMASDETDRLTLFTTLSEQGLGQTGGVAWLVCASRDGRAFRPKDSIAVDYSQRAFQRFQTAQCENINLFFISCANRPTSHQLELFDQLCRDSCENR